MKTIVKKADLILISALLLVIGALLLALYAGGRNAGAVAVVEMNGEVVDRLPLDTDTEKTYVCEGGGYNTVLVKNGRVSVSAADCPDALCVRHRAVRKTGETVICLPHRLTVTVEGVKEAAPGVDAVA